MSTVTDRRKIWEERIVSKTFKNQLGIIILGYHRSQGGLARTYISFYYNIIIPDGLHDIPSLHSISKIEIAGINTKSNDGQIARPSNLHSDALEDVAHDILIYLLSSRRGPRDGDRVIAVTIMTTSSAVT